MGENRVSVAAAADPAKVRSVIETVLRVAEGISRLTPTTFDDQAIALLKEVLLQDWAIELIVLVMNLFFRGPNAQTVNALRSVNAAFAV